MGISGWVFLFLVCVFLPYLVVKSALRLKKEQQRKPVSYYRHIVSALFAQAFMLAIALAAATDSSIPLFPRAHFEVGAGLVGAAMLVVMLGTMPWRRKLQDPARRARTRALRPHNARELAAWAAISLAAGFGEEIAYRGVLFSLLYHQFLHENWWATTLICSALFAVVHLTQGWVPAAFIFAFTIGLHWIVRESGNLYTAMILHFVYDLLAGVLYAFVLQKLDPPIAPESEPVKEPVTSGM